MSAANLALIFAPCILRTNQTLHAQDQLRDIERQAICVQALIEEKLRQFRSALTEIVSLETATEKVYLIKIFRYFKNRLSEFK